MSGRRKVTVVGAGNVGATCAQLLASRDYADVVLVDIKEGLPQGKALDIDQMGRVVSATTVGGIPLRRLVGEKRIAALVERTAKGGGELVQLLGTSAWYAPGAAAAQMVDAIMLDEKRVLPCTAYLQGEYGIDGLYIGVPVTLGRGAVAELVEPELCEGGQTMLDESADADRDVGGR